jgi:hypothetical protein
MRPYLLSFLVTSSILLQAASALAQESNDDASIGTRPAASPGAPQSVPPQPSDLRVAEDSSEGRPSRRVYVASDPPGDWAVLHAGLRPHIGTFGGIATLALAHARSERFYGVFSLSMIRNDAGTHVGLAQTGLGRNLSDEFIGGAQVSLTENRARTFRGIGQTSLAYNRSLSMVGVLQLAAFNRAKSFGGGVQLGGYNRTDEEFTGIAQLGAFNHSRNDFSGVLQLGAVNGSGKKLFGDDEDREGQRFAGFAQIGVVNSAATFRGVAQLGAVAFSGDDFAGAFQIGVLGAGSKRFRGLAQIGVATVSEHSHGAQIGGGAIALEEHTGLQLGVVANYAGSVSGAQIGLANIADKVEGIQIGLFNHAKELRGVQIGLANHAEDGVLPWTALINMGFGDGDGGATLDEGDDGHEERAGGTSLRF